MTDEVPFEDSATITAPVPDASARPIRAGAGAWDGGRASPGRMPPWAAALLGGVPGAFALFGPDGMYLYANRSWMEFCLAEPDGYAGRDFTEVFPRWKGDWAGRVLSCLEDGRRFRGAVNFRDTKGAWRHGQLSVSPLEIPGEDLSGVLFVCEDRSDAHAREAELKRRLSSLRAQEAESREHGSSLVELTTQLTEAHDAAVAANRSKSQFFANISHELRSPLNAIIGFSEILQKELFGPIGQAQYREYVHDIRDSAEHLLQIINDILDLSKIEAGKFDLQESDVGIVDLIESCIRLMEHRAEQGEVEISFDLPSRLPMLYADERKVKQILINLLSNSVKFTPAGGGVMVSAHETDAGAIELAVSDTGIGMTKDDLKTAFAVFGQVDGEHAKAADGTGLGLPLSRSLADLHEAALEIESEPGLGTTAVLRFPPSRTVNRRNASDTEPQGA